MKWDDATYVDWLDVSHQNEPENLEVVAAMIRILPRYGRRAEAADLVRLFEKRCSECWQLSLSIAIRHFEHRDYGRALHVLEGDRQRSHCCAEVWLLRGRILRQLGQNEPARMCLENAITLDPVAPAPQAELRRIDESVCDVEQILRLEEYADLRDRAVAGKTVSKAQLAEIYNDFGLVRAAHVVSGNTSVTDSGVSIEALAGLGDIVLLDFDLNEQVVASGLSSDDVRNHSDLNNAVRFVDVAEELGLKFEYQNPGPQQDILLTSLGGGVGVLDYDNDLWPDLYFAQGQKAVGAPDGRICDQLIRNRRGQCSDVTDAATTGEQEFSHGVSIGDFNNDGFADVFVCNYGTNVMWRNNGDGTFSDATVVQMGSKTGWSTSATFIDLDLDGDLDLYVARYVAGSYEEQLRRLDDPESGGRPNDFDGESDLLYENLGDGRFADRSQLISEHTGNGLAVTVLDYNADGRPDIFVGNDATHNFLFQNGTPESGPWMLLEVGMSVGVALGQNGYSQACMGLSVADINHDGARDLIVANYEFEPNSVYVGRGGMFEECASQFGLAAPSMDRLGWGAQFVDANNDSFDDLVVLNSHLYDQPMPTDVYINRFGSEFVLAGAQPGGEKRSTMRRAIATCDWNLDGRMDLVTTSLNGAPEILINRSLCESGILVRLVGRFCNRDALGVAVHASSDSGPRYITHSPREAGYLTTNGRDVLIPPGFLAEVTWPGGTKTAVEYGDELPVRVFVEP